jgi:hypothetical protein
MQVLSVMQPWATMLALGFKRLETRTWQTRHRGPLAIHAARRRMTEPLPMGWRPKMSAAQQRLGLDGWPDLFPRGAILGVVELLDCVPVEDLEPGEPDAIERMLGNFGPGHWVWRLGAARPLRLPVLVCGQQGVFYAPLPEPLTGLAGIAEDVHVQLA